MQSKVLILLVWCDFNFRALDIIGESKGEQGKFFDHVHNSLTLINMFFTHGETETAKRNIDSLIRYCEKGELFENEKRVILKFLKGE